MKLRYKALIVGVTFLGVHLFTTGLSGEFDINDLVLASSFSSSSSPSIEHVLDQEFFFLGKGHQAYAFRSKDGNYVLKLLKLHYPRFLGLRLAYLPFGKALYRQLAWQEQEKRLDLDCKSYQNALELFRQESLTELLHLSSSTHLPSTLTLYDKCGLKRVLNPNKMAFVLQRYAPPLEEHMRRLAKEGRREEAKQVVQNLLHLILKRNELRFYLPTHKFHANFGIVEGQPIQYDIGRLLTRGDMGLSELEEEPDMANSLGKLRYWLERTTPSFLSLLDECTF